MTHIGEAGSPPDGEWNSHGRPNKKAPVICIDADIENADWTKKTWDLPTDKAEFLAYLKASGTTVENFKQLPVYRWNLDKVPWLKEL